ncbi:MAG: universal stress protein [Anaerolineae bacterium]
MGPIVCATRGGGASHRTQERAIALAKEQSAELTFLCIVDANFAGALSEKLAAALEDELRRLGRSLLHIAEVRAQEQGVSAQTVCMFGPVQENIKAYLQHVNASTLVIGQSRPNTINQVFCPDCVDDFAEMLRQSTSVEVIVVT